MPRLGDYYAAPGSTEKYRINETSKTVGGEGGYGEVMTSSGNSVLVKLDPSGTPAPTVRNVSTTDPIADSYNRLSQAPTEEDRQSLRAQAIRDVQSQLDAQRTFYQQKKSEEQTRLKKMSDLRARQVNALTSARGMSGSSIGEAEKATQAESSMDIERQSMEKLNAEQAAAEASLTGAAVTGAEAQYAAKLKASQDAEMKRLDYLASLKPKAAAPITVAAGQSVIDPTTGAVIYQSKAEDAGKSYTLSPGQTVVDGSGKVIYTAPSSDAMKTITLSPGQKAFDAQGNVIAEVPATDAAGKTYTLSPGQTVFDASGKPIASMPGTDVSKAPTSVQEYEYAKQGGYTGSYTDFITQKAAAGAPKTIDSSMGQLQYNEAKQAWEPVTVAGKPVGSAASVAKDAAQIAATNAAKETAVAMQDRVTNAKNLVDETSTFGPMGRLAASKIPGTKSYALAQVIGTIKSNLGLGQLMQMKESSGNGSSGLGALSDNEMKMLTDSVASLDLGLDDKTLKTNLDFISQKYQKFVDALAAPTQSAPAQKGEDLVKPDGSHWVDDGTGNYVPKAEAPASGAAKTGGSASFRNNNPLNIKYGDFAKSHGAIAGSPATDGGVFAKFPSVASGLTAAKSLLRSGGYANLPLEQAMRRWSGNGYGADVAPAELRNKTLAQMSDAEINSLIGSMQKREGWYTA